MPKPLVLGVYDDLRCNKCNKLLARGGVDVAGYEMMCLRCGAINTLFKDLDDQIIITNANGTIIYVNERVMEVTGYSMDEIIGKRPSTLWGGQMSRALYQKMWRAIKKEKRTFVARLVNKRKNGKEYRVQLRISPVLDSKGNVKMFIGTETIIK